MLTPEQTLRFEIVKLLVQSGVAHEQVEDAATRLVEWILMGSQLQLCSTGDKAAANMP